MIYILEKIAVAVLVVFVSLTQTAVGELQADYKIKQDIQSIIENIPSAEIGEAIQEQIAEIERAERERLEQERLEQERLEQERIEQEQKAAEEKKKAEEEAAKKQAEYPLVHSDETCTITIYKEWYENAWVYAAHLEFTDYSRFGTDCANGKYGGGYETTSHAAKRLDAIFAVNGCLSAKYLDYTVVRSGKLWNGGERTVGSPAVYSNQTGEFMSGWFGCCDSRLDGQKVEDMVNAGLLTDTFCFGPPVLINGEVQYGEDKSRAQRTFIGSNGNPGDIWVFVSDGRYNDGESAGLTYNQMGEFMLAKGCVHGIPLDGGGSSTMYFKGKVLNAVRGKERSIVDFIYLR